MANKQTDDVALFLVSFQNLNERNVVDYDGRTLRLQFSEEFGIDYGLIKRVFNKFEKLPMNQMEIVLSSCILTNVFFFYKEIDFIKRYSIVEDIFSSSHIIILKGDNPSLIKEIDENYNNKNCFVYNFHEYKETLKYFLSTPELIPYKSETDKIFTLISRENGVFNVGYNLPKEEYFSGVNLSGISNRYQQEFQKKEFIQFFKEIIISSLHTIPEKFRYNEMIKSSSALINLAQRDYETYVLGFAFDKIKSEFKSEREIYFDSLDKSIASIGKQVVSFPLTFAATVFASYKVKDQPGILLLILLAYLLYSVVAFLILRMTSYNVKCLNDDVLDEEAMIKNSYKVIYKDFKEDFKKIKNKISKLDNIIMVLYTVLIFLFLLFGAYAAHTIGWIDLESLVQWVSKLKVEQA